MAEDSKQMISISDFKTVHRAHKKSGWVLKLSASRDDHLSSVFCYLFSSYFQDLIQIPSKSSG